VGRVKKRRNERKSGQERKDVLPQEIQGWFERQCIDGAQVGQHVLLLDFERESPAIFAFCTTRAVHQNFLVPTGRSDAQCLTNPYAEGK
jgi:hypothetical protein